MMERRIALAIYLICNEMQLPANLPPACNVHFGPASSYYGKLEYRVFFTMHRSKHENIDQDTGIAVCDCLFVSGFSWNLAECGLHAAQCTNTIAFCSRC